ncbi:hypothetical protein B296_00053666 [Ensete ventricosum]|uniref:Uncharacterized protein n=1 Tax=Ensete ventricosum TaxID=4639 RepID=A0A426WW12_ENSVE|nr:hypothetical protein B296_00053666 [Ensete ventricosum]
MSVAESTTSPAVGVTIFCFQQHRRPPSPAPTLIPVSVPAIDPTTLAPAVSNPLLQVTVDRFHRNRCTASDALLQPISLPTSSRAPTALVSPVAGNAEVDSVADAPHFAADFFCSRSSTSSTVLSLSRGLHSQICWKGRSPASSLNTDLIPPSTQIYDRSPASSLNTDLFPPSTQICRKGRSPTSSLDTDLLPSSTQIYDRSPRFPLLL